MSPQARDKFSHSSEALRGLTLCGSWTVSYLAEAGAPKPTQAPPFPSGIE